MSVTKLVIPAALIAVTLVASTRGDAILTLGVFSAPSNPVTASSGSAFNLASTGPTNPVASTPAPVASFAPSGFQPAPSPSIAAPTTYDAFVNFGNGPFANADSLTNGNALPWYDSSKVIGLFGGQPTTQQINSFDSTVLQRVQQTFALGGVPVTLTGDPGAAAAHTLSVVSNTVNPSMNDAIGMTNVGGNGFHFIDNSAGFAKTVDQLEWIVAHNVAHELMLAFGVPEVHDQTGRYIDSTVGSMTMFLNPNATFSSGAIQDLLSKNFLQSGVLYSTQAQSIGAETVPEPATLAFWGVATLAVVAARRARSRRAAGA